MQRLKNHIHGIANERIGCRAGSICGTCSNAGEICSVNTARDFCNSRYRGSIGSITGTILFCARFGFFRRDHDLTCMSFYLFCNGRHFCQVITVTAK